MIPLHTPTTGKRVVGFITLRLPYLSLTKSDLEARDELFYNMERRGNPLLCVCLIVLRSNQNYYNWTIGSEIGVRDRKCFKQFPITLSLYMR